jgi:probable addiction module antidote protein
LLISKSKIKLIPWDVADHLRTPYEMALYLEATFDEFGHEGRAIIRALGDIARAQGMTSVARRSGLGRESLYKALSGEGNPSFDTVLRVLDALGLRLTAVVREPAPAVTRAPGARAARKRPARKRRK